MNTKGLVIKTSNNDFETTYQKLRGILEGNPNLKIILELDHSKNAANADIELLPTRIILFGNPKLGTPLMLANRTVSIDLPQKMIVFQEASGEVKVAYNDPAYLKERHALADRDEVLAKVSGALDKICLLYTSPSPRDATLSRMPSSA